MLPFTAPRRGCDGPAMGSPASAPCPLLWASAAKGVLGEVEWPPLLGGGCEDISLIGDGTSKSAAP